LLVPWPFGAQRQNLAACAAIGPGPQHFRLSDVLFCFDEKASDIGLQADAENV